MNWNFMFYLNSSKSLSTRKGFPWYPSVLEHGISKYHSENSALLVGPTENKYQYSFPIKKEIKFFPLTLNQKSSFSLVLSPSLPKVLPRVQYTFAGRTSQDYLKTSVLKILNQCRWKSVMTRSPSTLVLS